MSVRRGTSKTDYGDYLYPGRKLRVKDEQWYLENAVYGRVSKTGRFYSFTDEMSVLCGQDVTVERTYLTGVFDGEEIVISEDGGNHVWHRWMFEDAGIDPVELL